MQLVQNNPFRILGLLAGTKAREQERQVRRLKQFIEAGQEPEEDFSFPVFGEIKRSIKDIDDSLSKINLDGDKLKAALFWFYIGNEITDEPAFDAIKDSEIQTAEEIWSKLTASGHVTKKNASAFQNLSTLLLYKAFQDSTYNQYLFDEAVKLKLQFFESDFIKDFKTIVTDKTFKTSKKELERLFLDSLLQETVNNNGGADHLIEILFKEHFFAKDDFLREYTQKLIKKTEDRIQRVAKKRKADSSNALKSGYELYEQSQRDLSQIKRILGTSDIKYVSISDKISEEILQCAIDYFKFFQDSDTDPGLDAMELINKAQALAVGNIVLQRFQENIRNIQEWIDNKPIREKEKIFDADLVFINARIKELNENDKTIFNITQFIKDCKPKLKHIKTKFGASDVFYLSWSTKVFKNAESMLVDAVNDAMEKRNAYVKYSNMKTNLFNSFGMSQFIINNKNITFNEKNNAEENKVPFYSLESLKIVVLDAWQVSTSLGKFNIEENQRQHYNKNRETLKRIYKDIYKTVIFFNDTPVPYWVLWMTGIVICLTIIAVIWGRDVMIGTLFFAGLIGLNIIFRRKF